MVSFDEVISHLGNFKKSQLITYFVGGACVPLGGWMAMASIFILGSREYRCSLPGWENDTYVVQNAAHEQMINATVPVGSKCTMYDLDGNETRCSSWVYDQTYFTPSAVMEFNLVCERMIYRSNANMAFMLGLLVGGVIGGELSDRFGRRKALLCGVALQGLAGITSGLVPEVYSFIVMRFLIAVGGTFAYSATFVLVMEMVGPSKRQLVGICLNFFYAIGVSSLTLFAYFIRNWRHLTLVTSSFFALLISYWWLIPESPRWLLAKDRKPEAIKIIRKIARVNKRVLPEMYIEELNVEQPGHHVKEESLIHLAKSRTCMIRLFILILNWVAISTAFYGLALNSGNLSGDLYINYLVMSLIEVPAYLFALLAPYKLGRKIPHTFCMLLGGVACVASVFVVLFGNDGTEWVITALSTIGKFGASAAFASVYVYTAEVIPTPLRNRAVGICGMCARVGNMISPYISDLGELIDGPYSDVLPLIVFGTLCVIAGILSLFLPETFRKHLPETIAEAEAIDMKRAVYSISENSDKQQNETEIPLNITS
ncbi:organic cation transporter protein-like isoform X2 [Lineus longissimus]|uniref:organic cation transporter protein-like isoform X2 n=1 Tax=Lineus longissimus TaxID=88925 RepID=UPI002B4D60FA